MLVCETCGEWNQRGPTAGPPTCAPRAHHRQHGRLEPGNAYVREDHALAQLPALCFLPAGAEAPNHTEGPGPAAEPTPGPRQPEGRDRVYLALHRRGCSCGLNPPVSSSDLAI
jgi:hypothetical protein